MGCCLCGHKSKTGLKQLNSSSSSIMNMHGDFSYFCFLKIKKDKLQNRLTEKGNEKVAKVKFEIWKQIFKENNKSCNRIICRQ